MPSTVADSAHGPNAAVFPAVDASTREFQPAVADANGLVDGISGSADTPGNGEVAGDADEVSATTDLAARSQAAASSSAPRPSPSTKIPTQQPLHDLLRSHCTKQHTKQQSTGRQRKQQR